MSRAPFCSSTLYLTLGPSDKEYQVSVQKRADADGWDCLVHYGRRGAATKGGPKNKEPLSQDEALALYEKTVGAQVAQGYTADPSGHPGTHPLSRDANGVVNPAVYFQTMRCLPTDRDGKKASEDDLIRVGRGKPTTFRPAGLPVPTWCAVVNPGGPDDPVVAFNERQLSAFFEPYNNDASLTIIENASLPKVIEDLWQTALKDATYNAECDNGGAYAVWSFPDGRLAVGGFDNGGSDVASFGAREVAERQGAVVGTMDDAHFDVASFLDPERQERPEERAVVAAIMALAAPAPSSRPHP